MKIITNILHFVSKIVLKYKKIVAISFSIVILLSSFLVFKSGVSQNILELLPQNLKSIKSLKKILKDFGTHNNLFIDIYNPNASTTELSDFSMKFYKKLNETKLFRKLNIGVSNEFKNNLFKLYFNKMLYLIDKKTLTKIRSSLNKTNIRKRVNQNYAELQTLASFAVREIILNDPLNLRNSIFRGLFKHSIPLNVKLVNNIFFSKNEKHVLIMGLPKKGAFNINFSNRLFKKMNQIFKTLNSSGNYKLKYIGGHYFSLEHSKVIKRDVAITFTTSLIIVLLIFYFRFRKLSLILVTLIPLIGAVIFAGCVIGLVYGKINLITIGFGAIILGMSIDYIIHFFIHFFDNYEKTQSRDKCLKLSIVNSGKSISAGAITTIAAFAVISQTAFSGLAQAALFCISGIFFSLIITIVFIPSISVLYSKNVKQKSFKINSRLENFNSFVKKRFSFVIVAVLGLTLFMLINAFSIKFDSNIKKLDKSTFSAKQNSEYFKKVYGSFSSALIILTEHKDLNKALILNRKVYKTLNTLEQRRKSFKFYTISKLLPPESVQIKNLKSFLKININKYYSIYKKSALRKGFLPKALELYSKILKQYKAGIIKPITFKDISTSKVDDLFSRNIKNKNGSYKILTMIYPGKKFGKIELKLLKTKMKQISSNIHITGNFLVVNELAPILKKDLFILSITCLIAIILILFIYHKNIILAILNLIPATFSIIWSLGLMKLMGISINIINVVITSMIIGIGVDYGIYIIDEVLKEKGNGFKGIQAIVLAGLTTIAGFGTLILAKYPILFSIGISTFFGILFVMLNTLFIIYPISLKYIERSKRKSNE